MSELGGIYKSGKGVPNIDFEVILRMIPNFVESTFYCRKESRGNTPQFRTIYEITREAVPTLNAYFNGKSYYWDDFTYDQKMAVERLIEKSYKEVKLNSK